MDAAERTTGGRAGWSRRRKLAIALGAVALAGAAFLAGSGGEVGWLGDGAAPEPADGDADWGLAETVAVDDDGAVVATVELAPANHGRCLRVRIDAAVGAAHCGPQLATPWDDPEFEVERVDQYFGALFEHAAEVDGRWTVALSGAVHPAVVRVTAHFGDGRQYSFVTRNPGGWFVTVLPDDVADPAVADGRLVNAPARLELFDAEGTRLATVDRAILDGARGDAVA